LNGGFWKYGFSWSQEMMEFWRCVEIRNDECQLSDSSGEGREGREKGKELRKCKSINS
jgi:hypothetical protein